MDLTGLLVERVVVHQMPRKEPKPTAEQQEPVVLSETVSPLSDSFRVYLNVRLLGSLQSADRAFDVVFDPSSPTDTPTHLRRYLRDEATGRGSARVRDQRLVDLSRMLAERLFDVQSFQPPPGLLAVTSGTVGSRPFVGVMKLEHERGVTADEIEINGRRTFEMTVEERLVLTAGTKVFKAAAFSPLPGSDMTDPVEELLTEGRLSDSQNPFTASEVAAYFARGLLGVKLQAEPRVLTEQVFKSVEVFINTKIPDPAARVAAERALLVEMASNKQNFSAQSFGNQHLDAPTRQALRNHLRSKELPTGAFPKNLELIGGRLRMMSLELDGKITVVAPEDKFDDDTINVDTSAGTQQAVVTIRAGLRHAGSRGR